MNHDPFIFQLKETDSIHKFDHYFVVIETYPTAVRVFVLTNYYRLVYTMRHSSKHAGLRWGQNYIALKLARIKTLGSQVLF